MLKKSIIIFLISILPIVELRGAIPFGVGFGLPFYITYPLAVAGNLLPVPFILLFIPKILDFLSRFKCFRPIVSWLHRKADKGSKKLIKEDGEKPDVVYETIEENEKGVASKNENRKMSSATFIALLSFVAIPLPVTGAWTGALIASLFSFPRKRSFLAILLGVLISGVIVSLISYGVLGFLNFLL